MTELFKRKRLGAEINRRDSGQEAFRGAGGQGPASGLGSA